MQFSKTTSFSLFSLAVASPMKRTAATVATDIVSISTGLTAFDSAIKKFTGSFITALSVLSAYNTLDSAVNTATADVISTGTLNSTDSATTYAALNNLTTQIASVLTDAKAQYSVVESSGYAAGVCESIGTLYLDINNFYEALREEIDSAYTQQVTTLEVTVDNDFAATIGLIGC